MDEVGGSHLIKWEVVMKSMNVVGLIIGSLR